MTENSGTAAPTGDFYGTSRRLANYLANLVSDDDRRDRAKLAALRRGLGKPDGWDAQLASVVGPHLGSATRRQEVIFYQVAALFGLHPVSRRAADDDKRRAPLTDALLTLVRSMDGTFDDNKAPFDRRVMAMLNADSADVINHLRYAVGRLRGSDIGVDWRQLMIDLYQWDDSSKHIQRQWARSWWNAPAAESPGESSDESAA